MKPILPKAIDHGTRLERYVKPGSFFYFTVKKTEGSKYLIKIGPKTLWIESDTPLPVGERIKGQLTKDFQAFKVFLEEIPPLPMQGPTLDNAFKMLYPHFASYGLRPKDSMIKEVIKRLGKRVSDIRMRGLSAVLIDKNLDLSLLELEDYFPEPVELDDPFSLFPFTPGLWDQQLDKHILFNHLSGKDKHWMLFPFHFIIKKVSITGQVRVLYDTAKEHWERIVFSFYLDSGVIDWVWDSSLQQKIQLFLPLLLLNKVKDVYNEFKKRLYRKGYELQIGNLERWDGFHLLKTEYSSVDELV